MAVLYMPLHGTVVLAVDITTSVRLFFGYRRAHSFLMVLIWRILMLQIYPLTHSKPWPPLIRVWWAKWNGISWTGIGILESSNLVHADPRVHIINPCSFFLCLVVIVSGSRSSSGSIFFSGCTILLRRMRLFNSSCIDIVSKRLDDSNVFNT